MPHDETAGACSVPRTSSPVCIMFESIILLQCLQVLQGMQRKLRWNLNKPATDPPAGHTAATMCRSHQLVLATLLTLMQVTLTLRSDSRREKRNRPSVESAGGAKRVTVMHALARILVHTESNVHKEAHTADMRARLEWLGISYTPIWHPMHPMPLPSRSQICTHIPVSVVFPTTSQSHQMWCSQATCCCHGIGSIPPPPSH
jgi:hypothetical protein